MGTKSRLGQAARLAGAAVLLACTALYAWRSRGWPLVNDPALMHYVVFLMDRGFAPYQDIGDINLPGAWVPEWASLRLGALLHIPQAGMWRAMDWLALARAGGAMRSIAGRRQWFAGVWAALLFALAHGAHGVGQAGQRDLWMAALLVWAVAGLAAARRTQYPGWAVFAGCAIGAAVTVKPFAVFWLVLLGLLPRRPALLAAGSFLLPLLGAAVFLARQHAVAAWRQALTLALPYHARLGGASLARRFTVLADRPLRELLFVLAAVLALAAVRRSRTELPERLVLVASTLLGLFSFLAQGKGYPYQVYPCTAFLLLWTALEFDAAARARQPLPRPAGVLGLALGVLVADRSWLRAASRATWPMPVVAAMETALRPFPDGEVQCVDSVSGCTDALLYLGKRQATGNLYDEFLFPQTPSPWGVPYSGPAPGAPVPPAVAAGQARFRDAVLAHPPQMFLVTTWLFPQGPGDYRKLALWPWFDGFLRDRYRLQSQQNFPWAENGPMGFRVYVKQ